MQWARGAASIMGGWLAVGEVGGGGAEGGGRRGNETAEALPRSRVVGWWWARLEGAVPKGAAGGGS
jgi:hypothetical protein